MNDVINIEEKRLFWRRVAITGVLIVVVSLLAMLALYISGMNAAKVNAESELEIDLAILSARGKVLADSGRWALPFAILGSIVLNVSRYKLRKLIKLEKIKNP